MIVVVALAASLLGFAVGRSTVAAGGDVPEVCEQVPHVAASLSGEILGLAEVAADEDPSRDAALASVRTLSAHLSALAGQCEAQLER